VDAHIAGLAVEHRFSDSLILRNRTSYGDFDKFYQNVYPTARSAAGVVTLAAYNDELKRKNLFSQTDLVWDGDIGGLSHILLLGFEIGRQDSLSRRRNGFFQPGDSPGLLVPAGASPTIAANVVFRQTNTNAARTPSANNGSEASILAFYAQEQLHLSEQVELVAGLRFDRFEIDVLNLNNNQSLSRADNLLSPRIGLIVKPIPELSLYASYGRSYLPSAGDQFSSLDLTTAALRPERFDNYEVGAKWEPVDGLLATVALYQLDRTNTRANEPGTNRVVLTGAQRSRGLEIGLERNITDRWQVSAGYALQEAQITRATAACPGGDCEVPLVPKHQFSMWNRYNVSRTLGFGLGVIAASGSFASLGNQVSLPGYARVDGAVFYQLSDGIEAQVNVENMFGADYFPTAHNDHNIAPGAPATARATLRFRF